MIELFIAILVLGGSLLAFTYGYRTARPPRALDQWVRDNWPDEKAAYKDGHEAGYQQGVEHAPRLYDE